MPKKKQTKHSELGSLEKEVKAFFKDLPDMLKDHENEYALYKNRKCYGYYAYQEDAMRAGYEKFGNVPFLVNQIKKEYEPVVITRFFI